MTVSIVSLASLTISCCTLLYVLWNVYQMNRHLAEIRKLREHNTKELLKSYDEIAVLRSRLAKSEHEQENVG